MIEGSESQVVLALGSNLPDRDLHLDRALAALSKDLDGIRESHRYETTPRYEIDQPDFLNSVAVGATKLSLDALLRRIHQIENEEGRDRANSGWMGPRPIDIDILLESDTIVSSQELTVPHPRMKERKFVLLPLLELLPDAIDPKTGRGFWEFFTMLPKQGIYYRSLDVREIGWP